MHRKVNIDGTLAPFKNDATACVHKKVGGECGLKDAKPHAHFVPPWTQIDSSYHHCDIKNGDTMIF